MITKIYKWLKEKDEDITAEFIVGTIFGLVGGLAVGLASGLAFGLASGLAVGLAFGLAFGLAGGLAFGLAFGLAGGLADLSSLMPINLYSIIGLIAGIIILAEILFGFNDKEKKPNFWRVAWLKIDSIFSATIIIINVLNLIWAARKINKEILLVILKGIGYIGAGLIVLGIIVGILYLWILWNKKRLTK